MVFPTSSFLLAPLPHHFLLLFLYVLQELPHICLFPKAVRSLPYPCGHIVYEVQAENQTYLLR